jgi:hypothetical protein
MPRPGFGRRARCAGVDRCTSRRQNAHITERRVILYRWHPWHGRTVLIVGAVSKGAIASFRCQLEEQDSRSLEVPQWMFDAATCCRLQQAAVPMVTCDALREVRALIAAVQRDAVGFMLQAEHPIPKLTGGAHAKQELSACDRSAGAVPSASAATVERCAGRRARSHGGTPRAIAAAARTRMPRDGGAG